MVDNGDKEKKEKQQERLRAFEYYFPRCDRQSSAIKKAKEDLEKIKKITDLEEKLHEVSIVYGNHRNNEGCVNDHYDIGRLHELGISRLDTIEKYHRLVKKL